MIALIVAIVVWLAFLNLLAFSGRRWAHALCGVLTLATVFVFAAYMLNLY